MHATQKAEGSTQIDQEGYITPDSLPKTRKSDQRGTSQDFTLIRGQLESHCAHQGKHSNTQHTGSISHMMAHSENSATIGCGPHMYELQKSPLDSHLKNRGNTAWFILSPTLLEPLVHTQVYKAYQPSTHYMPSE